MTIERSPVGAQGPCTTCDQKTECPAYEDLSRNLFPGKGYIGASAVDDVDRELDELVSRFVSMMRQSEDAGFISKGDRGIHLSALFDLAVTGIYTNKLLSSSGTTFAQDAILSGADTAYFPYTWMDPGSLVRGLPLANCYLPGARREKGRDFAVAAQLAKPGGRFIGDVGIKVLKALFRAILSKNKPHVRMRDGGGERGEFDLTITDATHLIFIEVKAKPLVCYPLKLLLSRPRESEALSWGPVSLDDVERLSLFMAASDSEIPIQKPTEASQKVWPLQDITSALEERTVFLKVLNNWKQHLFGYRQWEGEGRNTRWHRFGCGNFSVVENGERVEKRVANTKELPGLDRTDDIKKGAAQLLKFSRFKFDCKKQAIRCVLAGNTYAETHGDDYIAPLVDLKIRRSGGFGAEEWIFDAILGFTQNRYNSQDMAEFFELDNL